MTTNYSATLRCDHEDCKASITTTEGGEGVSTAQARMERIADEAGWVSVPDIHGKLDPAGFLDICPEHRHMYRVEGEEWTP